MLRPALHSRQSSLYGLDLTRNREGGGSYGQIVTIKRAADEKDREVEISLMKSEKSTGPTTDPCKTPRQTRSERLL